MTSAVDLLLSDHSDIIEQLAQLGKQVNSLRLQPVITALIGVLAAVLTAFMTAVGAFHSQRWDRRKRGQREAIYGAQDAMEALVKNWTKVKDWKNSGGQGDGPLASHKELQLITSLEKYVSRISDEKLRDAFGDWKDKARMHYWNAELGDGVPAVSFREEKDLRQRVIKLSGEEVRKLD